MVGIYNTTRTFEDASVSPIENTIYFTPDSLQKISMDNKIIEWKIDNAFEWRDSTIEWIIGSIFSPTSYYNTLDTID